MDLANLKNLPQLAGRPNFPQGLQVLLLDPNFRARSEAETLLKECGYAVALCGSSAEAAAYLSNPEHAVDVLLLEVKCLQQKTAENATLIAAAKLLPLVLMAEGSSDPSEVMLGIKLGAVDFLEKPLNPLKLKNIWTHTVRRLMCGTPTSTNNLHLMKKGAHPQQLQHLVAHRQQAAAMVQQQRAALCGTAVSAPAGVSSAAQQVQVQNMCASTLPVPGFAAGFVPLPSSPQGSSAGSHGSGGESGSNASTSDRAHMKADLDMDIEASSFQDLAGGSVLMGSTDALHLALSPHSGGGDVMDCDAPATSNVSSKQVRSGRSKQRQSNSATTAGGSPAVGYPAGQMPALPNVPGIEWGLPTNPLQISPKGLNGMMGAMGSWGPLGSVMPSSLFPPFLFGTGSLGSSPLGGSMGHLGGASMSTAPSAGSPLNLPAVTSISAPQMSTSSLMKRADSTPPSLVHMDHQFMPPPAVPSLPSKSAVTPASDLFASVDTSKPTLGLQLKKSPSLVDFISQSLKQGSGSPAC